jgi:ABC-2 type transport system ATP-binding protein
MIGDCMSGPPASTELIALDHVNVAFPNLLAVRNVSLTLHSGELLGLVGPNGAGKTTLLRAAAAIQPIFSGTVRIMGRTLEGNETELLPHIGFTPDTPPLYQTMRVREFLQFIAMGHGFSRAEGRERIDFWLEKVWLKDKADQVIASLSRGMRQRVGIARTLLSNPAVVLLDEPSGGIDPAGRVQFRELLIDLRRQGKALIVSSHILQDMNQYCTHIAMMVKGGILRMGTVDQIVQSDAMRCRYRILLSSPVESVADTLRDLEGVTDVGSNHQTITLEYFNGATNAWILLQHLIKRGLCVASFTSEQRDLEAAYLRAGINQVD